MDRTIDVSKPVFNPEMVEAIRKLRENETSENRNQVLVQIMRAHFLAPMITDVEPVRHEDGTATFKENTKVSFPMLVNAKKESYYPAFTDWDELHKWNQEENQKTAVFTFSDYASMILSDKNNEAQGFVINPYGGNLTIPKGLILALLKQQQETKAREVKVQKDTKILLGRPKEEPEKLKQAIAGKLKECKYIKSAWLVLKVEEESGDKSWLLVLDFKGKEQKEVYDQVAEAANPYLEGMYIDMISLKRSEHMKVEEITEPFYKRKGFFGR